MLATYTVRGFGGADDFVAGRDFQCLRAYGVYYCKSIPGSGFYNAALEMQRQTQRLIVLFPGLDYELQNFDGRPGPDTTSNVGLVGRAAHNLSPAPVELLQIFVAPTPEKVSAAARSIADYFRYVADNYPELSTRYENLEEKPPEVILQPPPIVGGKPQVSSKFPWVVAAVLSAGVLAGLGAAAGANNRDEPMPRMREHDF